MKNLLATLAVLGAAFGAVTGPASAQSFCACDGTGNVLPFSHKTDIAANGKTALNTSASRAYASEGRGISGPNSPEATGGGSAGYNEMLLNF